LAKSKKISLQRATTRNDAQKEQRTKEKEKEQRNKCEVCEKSFCLRILWQSLKQYLSVILIHSMFACV
jgi:hypothetical protein